MPSAVAAHAAAAAAISGAARGGERSRYAPPMSILAPDRTAATPPADEWSLDSARLLYRIGDWGKGYFGINDK